MSPRGYDGLPPLYLAEMPPLTPNLGLSLDGSDPLQAENFWLIDQAFTGAGTKIEINGSVVFPTANFNNTTPAAPAGNANVVWQVDGSGNISAYYSTAGGGGFLYTVVSKSSNYIANSGDDVWCTGTFVVTVPVLTTTQRVKVTNRGTGAITVSATSGTIIGNPSMILGTQWSSIELSGDGTNLTVE